MGFQSLMTVTSPDLSLLTHTMYAGNSATAFTLIAIKQYMAIAMILCMDAPLGSRCTDDGIKNAGITSNDPIAVGSFSERSHPIGAVEAGPSERRLMGDRSKCTGTRDGHRPCAWAIELHVLWARSR